MNMFKQVIGVAAFAAASALAQPALAQTIVAPTSGVINSGGPGSGPIDATFNQAGLASNYVPGVTNFDAYIATDPQHSLVFTTEWFSNQDTSSASVTYDFGAIYGIDALALWNEESSGIGTLNLWGSTDGVLFAALGIFNPFDNPLADYGPEVFTFASTSLRYVRFDMSECPQVDPGSYPACAIGEVAFRTVAAVPEPGTWAMMLFGFAGIGMALRRRRRQVPALAQAA